MHLSAPEGIGINDYIDKEDFPIHYATVDDVVAMVTEYGNGCIKAKIDLKAAFRMVPIVAEEWEGPLWITLPGTAQTLALFVTDLCMNLQPGTIQVYISPVSYLHHMNGHRSPASNNPMIKFLV